MNFTSNYNHFSVKFIPFEVRVRTVRLFHRFGNRILLLNVQLLYSAVYGHALDIYQFGCRNMNEFFDAMQNLFYLTQESNIVIVNCYIEPSTVSFVDVDANIRIQVTTLNDMAAFFKMDEFATLCKILQRTANTFMRIGDLEYEMSKCSKTFNILQYGFESFIEFFLTFSHLFQFTSIDSGNCFDTSTGKFKIYENTLFKLNEPACQTIF